MIIKDRYILIPIFLNTVLESKKYYKTMNLFAKLKT